MESVYSYVCTKMKLDPGQGVELSADGIMIEVEKSKQDEKAQILKQIKKAKELVDEADSAEVDGDTSEDWTPCKGVYLCHLFHVCRGGEKFVEPVPVLFCAAKGVSKVVGKGKGTKRKRCQSFNPPPLAQMKGNEEALLDAGLEGIFFSAYMNVSV